MPGNYGDGTYGSGTYGDPLAVVGAPGGPPVPPFDPSDRFASYKVEIAWSTFLPGVAVLDVSTLGGADTLGAGSFYLYNTFGGPYDDITKRDDNKVRVESIGWTRGRSDDLSEMQALSATITGRDPTGMMNIHNPNSPLNQGVVVNGSIRPLRPVRVTATFNGVSYTIFTGFLRSWDYQPDGRTGRFTLEVSDLFALLDKPRKDQPTSAPFPTIPYVSPCTTGQAIGLILDYVGFDDPALRDIDDGDLLPFFEATGDASALELIQRLLQTELGIFYIDPHGRAVYADRSNRYTRPVKTAVTNVMKALGSGSSVDAIRNKWTVTRQPRTGPGQYAEGIPQEASDFLSAHDYGERAETLASPFILTDALALQLAQALLAVTKDPINPVWQLGLDNRDGHLMYDMLTLDLLDRISVSEAQTGSEGTFFIEQIAGQITGHHHAVNYILSDRSAVGAASLDPFILGTDTLDGPKVLSF